MIVSAIPTNSSDRQLLRDQIQPDLNEKNSSQIFPDTKAISIQDTCLDFNQVLPFDRLQNYLIMDRGKSYADVVRGTSLNSENEEPSPT